MQLRGVTVVACWLAALSYASIAGAQTAYDGFDPGANDVVLAFGMEADGRILVGGRFTLLGGGGMGTTARNVLGRLNADGSIDHTFYPGANGFISTLAIQPDGKIVVGGSFTTLGGGGLGTTIRNRVGRVNPDGTLDASFDPNANSDVYALAIQPDGKVVIGGAFTTVGGTPRQHIARLNANGSVDTIFDPGANDSVSALAVQPDGRILVGGFFTTLGGGGTGPTSRAHIGRLNGSGTVDTSFDPGANGRVKALAVYADGKIVVGGYFTMLGGGGSGTTPRNYLGRLKADGSLDASFDPGANDPVFGVTLQADGKILVGGQFTMLDGGTGTTTRNHVGRINFDGSLDASFNPGANVDVYAIAEQPDRKILVGGAFTMLGGVVGTTARNYIGRVYVDGRLDVDFNPGAGSYTWAVAVQPDGDVVVGSSSLTPAQTPNRALERVHADGTVDTSFDPGANGTVYAVAIQPDGKIIVVGTFTTLGGGGAGSTTRNRIGRLNADGSLDSNFDPNANAPVWAVAVQPDGKVLVGGEFTTLGGMPRYYIGRLNADGSVDMSFNPGADSFVFSLALQPDGKIIAGGGFGRLGGGGTGTTVRQRVGRVSADGLLDATFDPGANAGGCCSVYAVSLQSDGKVLVGSSTVIRLNPDGSLDASFNATGSGLFAPQTDGKIFGRGGDGSPWPVIRRLEANGSADTSFGAVRGSWDFNGLAVQPDGKILAVGYFHWLQGTDGLGPTRNYIGRLTNTGAAIQNLTIAGVGHTIVTWTRSGVGPEVSRATFELSANGASYTPLGTAARVPGGWQLTGVSLPTDQNLFIRARGYYSGGRDNSSTSIVESVRNVYLRTGFTDAPLAAGATVIRAVHITELRTRIDVQRAISGLAAYGWTDLTLSPGTTIVRVQHILDLREALRQAYVARSLPAPVYVDPNLVAGTWVKAVHIQQLRNYLRAIE